MLNAPGTSMLDWLRWMRGPVFQFVPPVAARGIEADFDTSPTSDIGEISITFSGPKSDWASVYDVNGAKVFSGPSAVAAREAVRLAKGRRRHLVQAVLPNEAHWNPAWGRLVTP